MDLTFRRGSMEANGGQLRLVETQAAKSRFCFTVPTGKGDIDV